MDLARNTIIFTMILTFINVELTQARNKKIPGLWFDTGIDFSKSEFSDTAVLRYFKDGIVYKLVAQFSSNSASGLKSTGENQISQMCLNDTEQLLLGVSSKESYAIKFLDADGKLPPGVLQGSWNWVGDYQECYDIESPFNNITNRTFRGKYFSIAVYRNGAPFLNGFPLLLGACLPSSCDKSDAHAVADVAFAPLSEFNISVGFVAIDIHPPYDAVAITTFVISGILIFLIFLGTSIEIFSILNTEKLRHNVSFFNSEPNYGTDSQDTERTGLLAKDNVQEIYGYVSSRTDKMFSFLLCFSFIRNTKKLLNTSTAKGPLACLNGLRVISMWWVIQGHTYGFIPYILDNPLYTQRTLIERFTFQAIFNGTFSVDTFFFLSGLLVAYLALREISEKGRLNWIYFFVHRYWRLTPVYAFVLLMLMSMSDHLISGPFQWIVSDPEHGAMYDTSHSCYDYWWSNLLYINNLYPKYGFGGCFSWSWYLANDMQFYIFISPVLLILFKFKKIAGFVVSVLLILACIGIRGFLVTWYGIIHFASDATKHTDDPWSKEPLYTRPWARMSVYVVGFLTGFILQDVRCKIRMKRPSALVGWCIAAATALAVIYGLYYYCKHPDTFMTQVASGFYDTLSRTAWGLSLSWVVIASACGYGGPVNWFLSRKIWAPLGRLTYTAYLVHPIIIVVYQMNLMTPLHFTDLTLIYMFVSNLVFSYAAAYVVSMAVEAPMLAIEKLVLNKQS